MAAGSLPAPGTEYGPCTKDCVHRDCMETRVQAATWCRDCGEPIGYNRAFYKDSDGFLTHAECLERRLKP